MDSWSKRVGITEGARTFQHSRSQQGQIMNKSPSLYDCLAGVKSFFPSQIHALVNLSLRPMDHGVGTEWQISEYMVYHWVDPMNSNAELFRTLGQCDLWTHLTPLFGRRPRSLHERPSLGQVCAPGWKQASPKSFTENRIDEMDVRVSLFLQYKLPVWSSISVDSRLFTLFIF